MPSLMTAQSALSSTVLGYTWFMDNWDRTLPVCGLNEWESQGLDSPCHDHGFTVFSMEAPQCESGVTLRRTRAFSPIRTVQVRTSLKLYLH